MAQENTFSCPLLSQGDVGPISVDFEDINDPQSGVRAIMARSGVCIVRNVASSAECNALEDLLRQDLSELVDEDAFPTDQSDRTRVQAAVEAVMKQGVDGLQAATLRHLGNHNCFGTHGLCHGRFAWGARRHHRVKRVYSVLHEVDENDLVSSCDNTFFGPRGAPASDTNVSWPHIDQNDHDPNLAQNTDVYQGVLYVRSSESAACSTTVVWPGSHKAEVSGLYLSDPRVRERGMQGHHFTTINSLTRGSKARAFLEAGWLECARRVPVPAGALLLWSSHTTHQGWRAGPRLAQTVCWEPKSRRDALARERKLRMAALGLPSSHWASGGRLHGGARRHRFHRPTPAGVNGDGVVVPLRPFCPGVALVDGADRPALEKLLDGVSWEEPLSAHVLAALEAAVAPEIQQVL